jgi:hypothetical protein
MEASWAMLTKQRSQGLADLTVGERRPAMSGPEGHAKLEGPALRTSETHQRCMQTLAPIADERTVRRPLRHPTLRKPRLKLTRDAFLGPALTCPSPVFHVAQHAARGDIAATIKPSCAWSSSATTISDQSGAARPAMVGPCV